MNNDTEVNVFERLLKLWAMICTMIARGARDPHKVAETLQSIVDSPKIYLRELFTEVPVMAVYATPDWLKRMFPGGIYGDASRVSSSTATPATNAIVYEIVGDGTYTELFGSLELERRRFKSLFHVAVFCRDHRDKLRIGDHGTFFELDGGFVAYVYFSPDGLSVLVHPFSRPLRWYAKNRHRIVLPQLVA